MDPPIKQEKQKKLADIRKQITPGNDDQNDDDDDDNIDDQIHSSEQQDTQISQSKIKNNIIQQQERWEDVPSRQRGQTQALQPLQQQRQQPQQPQQQAQKQSEQPEQQNISEQKKQKYKQKEQKKYKQKQLLKKKKIQDKKLFKCKQISFDSRFIFAAHYLIRDQLYSLMKPQEGYIRFDPYINNQNILIYYHDEKKGQQIADKIDEQINKIQAIQMGKKQAESGVQLSYKYMQYLLKQNIAFFRDKTQNFKTVGYYICGKVGKKMLHQKLSQIKNMSFGWLHLYRYEDTRSYRAILRKIFDTPQAHQFALQKFKANQIEVGYLRKDFPVPVNLNKRGVLLVLRYLGDRKIAIHQQIQQLICDFINEVFAVFCFTFTRQKQGFIHRYTPKVDKVTWFFIAQHNAPYPLSYLYIIVKKSDFNEVKNTIIEQIKNMKLLIRGRRFFRNISPQKPDVESLGNYRLFSYPKNFAYSWTISAKKGEQFDWVSQLVT